MKEVKTKGDVWHSDSGVHSGLYVGIEDNEDLLNPETVAEKLGISRQSLSRRTIKGEIPHRRIGRLIRYKWSEILRAMEPKKVKR